MVLRTAIFSRFLTIFVLAVFMSIYLLQAGRPDQKIITYFLSSEDANEYLDEMTQVQRVCVHMQWTHMYSSMCGEEYNSSAQWLSNCVNLFMYVQSNSQPGAGGASEFRLMTTTLEKVMNTIQSKKQSRKLGRYEMDIVHRIQVSIAFRGYVSVT